MILTMQSPLQLRIKHAGSLPPVLLHAGIAEPQDGFEKQLMDMVEGGVVGLSFRADVAVEDFDKLMQMTSTDGVRSTDHAEARKVLERRRAILLAVIGATPSSNSTLHRILSRGFLIVVKSWLSEILKKEVGGVDLLLHMLSSIAHLPVTKEMISVSKLGKAVVSIEKDKICSGMNEKAIKTRIARVKEDWSASVKAHKEKEHLKGTGDKYGSPTSLKRPRESPPSIYSPTSGKKVKGDDRKSLSTSDLIRKVGTGSDSSKPSVSSSSVKKPLSAAEVARKRAQDRIAKEKARIASLEEETPKKKKTKHVMFADKPTFFEAPYESDLKNAGANAMSWSDRMRQEHLEEKQLLEQARMSDGSAETRRMTQWKQPQLLVVEGQTPVEVVSSEIAVQVARMATVRPCNYTTEETVPSDPTPLSNIEQALEMTSQSASAAANIPFYVPAQDVAASAAKSVAPIQQPGVSTSPISTPATVPIDASAAQAQTGSSVQGATLEVVTAMGLPSFLVGSNVQALQTVASTPGLLQTFVNANGMYDQVRLTNLVQTLSQSLAPPQQTSSNSNQVSSQSTFGQTALAGTSGYNQGGSTVPPPPSFQQPVYGSVAPPTTGYGSTRSPPGRHNQNKTGGYRGDQNLSEGNLHLSGYGMSTSKEEILALFAPYVQVSEIVPKGSFSFVNTNDPAGARRAKEALNGALLGGRPVRINLATRKERDLRSKPKMMSRGEVVPLPVNPYGHVDYEQVRDDRGNAATKNLFVAGYGQGTTEQQLRETFAQHGPVTGTVMKGSFAFVNTSDKETAVRARQALTGTVVNGGVLRINFAKESGRLGTSFDKTYNASSYGPAHSQRVYMA